MSLDSISYIDVSSGGPNSAITFARGMPGVSTLRSFLSGAFVAIITEQPVELLMSKRPRTSDQGRTIGNETTMQIFLWHEERNTEKELERAVLTARRLANLSVIVKIDNP